MKPYRCKNCQRILTCIGTDGKNWKYHCGVCHTIELKEERWEYIPAPEEIEEIKREYREEHTVIGTNDPVIINDRTAVILLKSRHHHNEYLNSVHESHDMTEWESKIMAPAGTSRFYTYRECKVCGYAQYYHTAGKFIDPELKRECIE